MILTIILVGLITLAFRVEQGRAAGNYIRADGRVDPPDLPISTSDNVTYMITGDVLSTITVQRSNIIVDGSGYTLQPKWTVWVFELESVYNVTITSTNIGCIYLASHSLQNVITRNRIGLVSPYWGIQIESSEDNLVFGNDIINCYTGIMLKSDARHNEIFRNNIVNDRYGIDLYDSSSNMIYENSIAGNFYGLYCEGELHGSGNDHQNVIFENNFTNCGGIGIGFEYSSNNTVIHNNFLNNPSQTYSYMSTNIWDNGYPSGGNHWSDYTGGDRNDDNIGDTPYIIDANNTDRYPLMSPFNSLPYPRHTLTITRTAWGDTNPLQGNYTLMEGQVVTVQAIPDATYILDHWELDGINIPTSIPITMRMMSNHHLHAVFVPKPKYILTIVTTDCGTTEPSPGTYTYLLGTEIAVIATPETSCQFGYWKLDGLNIGHQNPTTVVMNRNHTLLAVFTYSVIVKAHCSDEGADVNVAITMDGMPTGYTTLHIFSNLTGTHNFTIPNTDASGHQFKRWSTGQTDATISAASSKTCKAYYGIADIHDVALVDVTPYKTVVCEGYVTHVNVTVHNYGDYEETFNVIISANATQIQTLAVPLQSGDYTNVTFTWDTYGFALGKYTICATATAVQGETDLSDNSMAGTWIVVSHLGDVNGDGKVDIQDLARVSGAFGSFPGHLKWDPNCDINGDERIDISDLARTSACYGWHIP